MKKLFEELEMLMNHYKSYRPTVGTDVESILERRYQAFKFIKLGIHSREENMRALELCERLIDISETEHENEKDTWLLKKLSTAIEKFESVEYQ